MIPPYNRKHQTCSPPLRKLLLVMTYAWRANKLLSMYENMQLSTYEVLDTDLTLIPGATNVLSSGQPRVESIF